MDKKCLIIGGGGFIGYNLTEYLLKNDFLIKVIDKCIGNLKSLEADYSNLIVINGDIENTTFLIDHLEDYENIIWLVHTTVPSTSMSIQLDLTENIIPLSI